jgi:hypothetical protein
MTIIFQTSNELFTFANESLGDQSELRHSFNEWQDLSYEPAEDSYESPDVSYGPARLIDELGAVAYDNAKIPYAAADESINEASASYESVGLSLVASKNPYDFWQRREAAPHPRTCFSGEGFILPADKRDTTDLEVPCRG